MWSFNWSIVLRSSIPHEKVRKIACVRCEDVWKMGFQCFVQGKDMDCLVLILPQVEHSLRRLYVCVCDAPHLLLSAGNKSRRVKDHQYSLQSSIVEYWVDIWSFNRWCGDKASLCLHIIDWMIKYQRITLFYIHVFIRIWICDGHTWNSFIRIHPRYCHQRTSKGIRWSRDVHTVGLVFLGRRTKNSW